ncbi:MAG: hypothetical protein WCG23_12115 [bacterium]
MKILIYSDAENFNFFRKMVKPLNELGHEVHFLTNNFYNYLKVKKQGYKFFLVKRADKKSSVENIPDSLLMGLINLKNAKKLYSSIVFTLETLNDKHNYNLFMTWNGHNIIGQSFETFAKQHNIKMLYLEIANIDGKIFADPQGVNALSSLFANPEILEEFEVDEAKFEEWRENYLKNKLKSHIVRQAIIKKVDLKDLIFNYILGLFKKFILGVPNFPKISMIHFFKKRLKNKAQQKYGYDDLNIEKENYIFYPMQVSSDTQLMINSDIDNAQAIEIASAKAREKGIKLLVKPHPAETNKVFIKKIFDLKEKYGFYFVKHNTFQLISNSDEVITINSTVGLEAKILDKPVTFLGRSFFAKMNNNMLKKYIMGYLIDADYFNNEPIRKESAVKIIERVRVL